MAGDGIFKWYWGYGSEPESYYGEEDSREAILQVAYDESDGRAFTIIEADKSIPTFNIFDADRVIEDYEERNEECWGEDGFDGGLPSKLKRELEVRLSNTFKRWMEKHGLTKTWAFGTSRNQEYFPERTAE